MGCRTTKSLASVPTAPDMNGMRHCCLCGKMAPSSTQGKHRCRERKRRERKRRESDRLTGIFSFSLQQCVMTRRL
jgi:hypothetical protein